MLFNILKGFILIILSNFVVSNDLPTSQTGDYDYPVMNGSKDQTKIVVKRETNESIQEVPVEPPQETDDENASPRPNFNGHHIPPFPPQYGRGPSFGMAPPFGMPQHEGNMPTGMPPKGNSPHRGQHGGRPNGRPHGRPEDNGSLQSTPSINEEEPKENVKRDVNEGTMPTGMPPQGKHNKNKKHSSSSSSSEGSDSSSSSSSSSNSNEQGNRNGHRGSYSPSSYRSA
uniref:Uncharacterized protein n=1 Tax=Parastrongyloides trichosuri TaxID=131310 RepID=A0A0N4ZIN0_PARTI